MVCVCVCALFVQLCGKFLFSLSSMKKLLPFSSLENNLWHHRWFKSHFSSDIKRTSVWTRRPVTSFLHWKKVSEVEWAGRKQSPFRGLDEVIILNLIILIIILITSCQTHMRELKYKPGYMWGGDLCHKGRNQGTAVGETSNFFFPSYLMTEPKLWEFIRVIKKNVFLFLAPDFLSHVVQIFTRGPTAGSPCFKCKCFIILTVN